ncbi:MAG: HD domain-containing protein [Candidatus Pacebacteria bacterium]|nr:HD domain-containing protein [Candidatus Paceibacterota bacterium]
MISVEKLKEIKELGIEIDHKQAFDGKSHGNQHLFRAVKIAKYLSEKIDCRSDIVEASAWLHDTALPSGDDYNYENNKKIIVEILESINISPADKSKIAECVASHEGTKKPESIEAQIVHDADVLEKVGMLGLIRHTWKLTNYDLIDSENITINDTEKVIEHINWRVSVLNTDAAKKLSEKLHINLIAKDVTDLVSKISKLAKQSIITENIAIEIQNDLTMDQKNILELQLSQNYLN